MIYITKDTIPEGFTLSLALVDAIPVIFFGLNCILIGRYLHSFLFILGAVLCLLGGGGKVLWKIIVAVKKRNIWFLFIQMRFLMPTGFLLIFLSVLFLSNKAASFAVFFRLLHAPALLFGLLGIIGMCLMMFFAIKLDNTDKKSNWIEQLTNGFSQICFFVALLLI